MKNKLIIFAALLVIGAFVAIASTSGGDELTGNVVAVNTGEVQEVSLQFKNYAYVLEPETFTAGVPVRMEVDLSTVYGCMRDVRIPAFGVSQYVSEGNNIIEFTPTKTGTFNIMCSMNMGRGTFTVVDQTGTTSDFIEAAPAESGSCGGAAGGCGGCGG
jgi:uncharacterized protein